jgi:hypothetical protein
LRARQEGIAVARFAKRLRGHGANLPAFIALQTVGKARQTRQAAQHGFFTQQALLVQTGTQAHGFFEVFNASVFAVYDLGDFQPKAVGTHVDGREMIGPA